MERWGCLGLGSLDRWEGLGGEPPRELAAQGQIVGVVLVESPVETTPASVSQSRLGSPPPLRGGSRMRAAKSRQEKPGQAALGSRAQEDSPRLGRQGCTRTSGSRVVRGRAGGLRGGWGSPGPAPALGRRRPGAEDCASWERRSSPPRSRTPGLGTGAQASSRSPGPLGCFSLSSPSKWAAPPLPSPAPGAQWKVPRLLRSPACVAWDAGTVARESPGYDG